MSTRGTDLLFELFDGDVGYVLPEQGCYIQFARFAEACWWIRGYIWIQEVKSLDSVIGLII